MSSSTSDVTPVCSAGSMTQEAPGTHALAARAFLVMACPWGFA